MERELGHDRAGARDGTDHVAGVAEHGTSGYPPQVRVVYVLEFARSGGTIFSLTLGSAPNALAIGEPAFYPVIMGEQRRAGRFHAMDYCSCGSPIASCPMWSAVQADLASQLAGDELVLPRDMDKRSSSVLLGVANHLLESMPVAMLRRAFRSWRLQQQLNSMERLVRSVGKAAGVATVIDKSGFAEQGLLYRWMPGVDVRYVHLIRDGRDVLNSALIHPDAQDPDSPAIQNSLRVSLIVALGWVYSNVFSSILGFMARDRYLRVRYEDLIADPAATLRRVGSFADLDMEGVIDSVEHGKRLDSGHMMQSNRAKFDPTFRTTIQATREAGGAADRSLAFAVCAGWLRRIYGYA